MKGHCKTYLISFIVMLMAIGYGCKKTENQELNSDFQTVKVYDDTLADIRNHSVGIAAGSNQLYMTYGVGRALYYDILNGQINSGGFDEFNARLMATDLDGNLKWIKELPTNRMADGILVLDDESVVIGTYTFSSYSTDFNLIRFNRNGEKIVEITAPIASNVTGYESIDLIRAFNGNILVCGTYYRDGSSGYICEYDLNLNQIWFKPYTGGITHVELAENNNYIFTQQSYNDSSIIVLRTNSTGDSLGSKYLNNIYNPICNDLVRTANGNYQISASSGDRPNIKSYIYEINQNGDLLYTTATSFLNFNYNAALVPRNDGGVFALMQEYLYDEQAPDFFQLFNEINSAYATFDAGLSLSANTIIQSKTSDNLTAACSLPTGEIACFGLIKSEGKIYYKPELIILK